MSTKKDKPIEEKAQAIAEGLSSITGTPITAGAVLDELQTVSRVLVGFNREFKKAINVFRVQVVERGIIPSQETKAQIREILLSNGVEPAYFTNFATLLTAEGEGDDDKTAPYVFDKQTKEFTIFFAWIFQDTDEPLGFLPALAPLSTNASYAFLGKVITTGGELKKSKTNRDERLSIGKDEKTGEQIFRRESRGARQEISIMTPEVIFGKYNSSFVKLLNFCLQKLQQQHYINPLTIDLREMVARGMYVRTDVAYRALDNFIGMTRSIAVRQSTKVKTQAGKKENVMQGGIMFYHWKRRGDYVQISVNEEFPFELFGREYTNVPMWGYSLNGDAYILFWRIFYLSRQSTKVTQLANTEHFSISLENVAEALGLPTPETCPNRKYKEKIKKPIIDAVDAVNQKAREDTTVNGTFEIAIWTDENADIATWLKGFLEVTLTGDYIHGQKQLAETKGQMIEAYKKEKAKLAGKQIAQAETQGKKRGRPRGTTTPKK